MKIARFCGAALAGLMAAGLALPMGVLLFGVDVLMAREETPKAGASQGADSAELAKKRQYPVADLTSLSFDNSASFGAGPHNRVQNELDIRPLVPFRLTKAWYLVTRTIAPVVRQPEEESPTGETWGLGDMTFTGFLAPVRMSAVTWGAGPVLSLPTGTHDTLGSRKWVLGPSAAAIEFVSLKQTSSFATILLPL